MGIHGRGTCLRVTGEESESGVLVRFVKEEHSRVNKPIWGSWVKTFLAFLLSSNSDDTVKGKLSSTAHGMGPGLWKVPGMHISWQL